MKKLPSPEIQNEASHIINNINQIMEYSKKKSFTIWYDPNAGSNKSSEFLKQLNVISDVKTFTNWQEAAQYLQNTKIPLGQVIASGKNNESFVREISRLPNVDLIHIFCENIEDHEWTNDYPKVVSVNSKFNEFLGYFKMFTFISKLRMGKYEMKKKEEIIIKSNINDIVKSFRKEALIIWYDPHGGSNESSKSLEELNVISDVKTFNRWQEAVEYLKNTEISHCQAIASGIDSERFVKEIYKLRNIHSIYIFDHIKDSNWATQYPKVMSFDRDFDKLKANLNKNLTEFQKKMSSLRTDLPVYAPIFDDIDKSKNRYLHFYLKGFVHFKNRTQAKQDLLDLARALYGENNKYIDDFEKNYNEYSMRDILRWYTRETFLYKITNNCLRIATTDSIQCCRFILRDLKRAIKEKYQQESKNFSGLLYRGAFISNQEWASLVQNKGKEIEIYGFLSTSKKKIVALSFVAGAIDKKVMITIVVPATPEKGEQGFAEIKNESQFEGEDEVLFNVMSRFTILEATEEIIEKIKCRHLILLYGAQEMRKFALKSPSIQITTKDLKTCHVCKREIEILNRTVVLVNPMQCNEFSCLNCLQEYLAGKNSAIICIPPAISTKSICIEIEGFVMKYREKLAIPFYGSQCEKCKSEKLTYCSKCVNCKKKKIYCERCFAQNKCIQQGHILSLETQPFSFWSEKMTEMEKVYLTYEKHQLDEAQTSDMFMFQQAKIFHETHDYKREIEYYNKFLSEYEIKKDPIIASTFNNLGVAYSNLGEYQKATEYYLKSIEILRSLYLGDENQDFVSPYSNLGNAYSDMGEYQKAIEYHSKALEIQQTILGDHHPSTASCYQNLGNVYSDVGEYQKAIKSYSKALEIHKTVLGDHHPSTASSYHNLGCTYSCLGEYQKAIEYHSKALEIQKTVLGDHHPSTATSYQNLGNAYFYLGEYKKAIKYCSKALEIQKTLLGDQNPSTATSYRHLGVAHLHLGEYQKAIEYHSKALEIQKTLLGDQNPSTSSSYENLGNAYLFLGEYQKAIEYHSKALEIQQTILGDQHLSTASSYQNLGNVYSRLGDYQKAFKYYSKALEIQKTTLGDQHPDTASSYQSLGVAYTNLGEYQKAIGYYSKALEIQKTVLGDQHQNTASSYQNLGFVYSHLGEYQKAIEYHTKALEIQQSVLGDHNPSTASSYQNLGVAYFGLKEYQKAIKYYSKALEIQKTVLGDQHQNTASSYGNLGNVYLRFKEYQKAIEYHSKALEIQKKVVGDQHPETAISYNNLGLAYLFLGEYQKAIKYYSKALEIQQTVLGDQHPNTSFSYKNLGFAYLYLGEYQKAIENCSKALEIRKKVLGDQHPSTAISYRDLIIAYSLKNNLI